MEYSSFTLKRFKLIHFTALTLFSLILIPNNKFYLLVFLIYGVALFLIFKFSLLKSLFATLLLSLPFERGIRDWVVEVVPTGPEPWILGYSFYFGLSIKFIIFTALLLFIIFSKEDIKKTVTQKSQWLLITLFFLGILSTVFSENIGLGLLGVLRLAFFIGLYLISVHLFTYKFLREHFKKLIVVFLLFFGFIGSWQFINRHPIGLFLEDLGSSGLFGYLTTDSGERLYRVAGLTGHPTFFGSFLSLLIPVGVGYLAHLTKKKNYKGFYFVTILAVFAGLIAIFATFSRSAWFTLIIGGLLFLYRHKKYYKKILNFRLISFLIGAFGIFIVLFGPLFFTRLYTFSDILNIGNAQGRLNLANQALFMIKKSPLFGVGLNQFTLAMSRQDLSLEARTFLYPVHNTFLLFFSEIGILAGLLFLSFVLISLYKTWKVANKDWVSFGIWVGAFSFLINAQFHTLFSLDPTLDLFMVMLAYLALL